MTRTSLYAALVDHDTTTVDGAAAFENAHAEPDDGLPTLADIGPDEGQPIPGGWSDPAARWAPDSDCECGQTPTPCTTCWPEPW